MFMDALMISLLLIGLGILFEKILSPSLNITECTRKFKADFQKIVQALLGPSSRHIFSESLPESFLLILDGYYHTAFEPSFKVTFYEDVPLIQISFIQAHPLTPSESQTLCKLLGMKFQEYLNNNRLSWKYFTEFHRIDENIIINIYYSEFKDDYRPFIKRYHIAVKEKMSDNYGVLRDERLNRELSHVK